MIIIIFGYKTKYSCWLWNREALRGCGAAGVGVPLIHPTCLPFTRRPHKQRQTERRTFLCQRAGKESRGKTMAPHAHLTAQHSVVATGSAPASVSALSLRGGGRALRNEVRTQGEAVHVDISLDVGPPR